MLPTDPKQIQILEAEIADSNILAEKKCAELKAAGIDVSQINVLDFDGTLSIAHTCAGNETIKNENLTGANSYSDSYNDENIRKNLQALGSSTLAALTDPASKSLVVISTFNYNDKIIDRYLRIAIAEEIYRDKGGYKGIDLYNDPEIDKRMQRVLISHPSVDQFKGYHATPPKDYKAKKMEGLLGVARRFFSSIQRLTYNDDDRDSVNEFREMFGRRKKGVDFSGFSAADQQELHLMSLRQTAMSADLQTQYPATHVFNSQLSEKIAGSPLSKASQALQEGNWLIRQGSVGGYAVVEQRISEEKYNRYFFQYKNNTWTEVSDYEKYDNKGNPMSVWSEKQAQIERLKQSGSSADKVKKAEMELNTSGLRALATLERSILDIRSRDGKQKFAKDQQITPKANESGLLFTGTGNKEASTGRYVMLKAQTNISVDEVKPPVAKSTAVSPASTAGMMRRILNSAAPPPVKSNPAASQGADPNQGVYGVYTAARTAEVKQPRPDELKENAARQPQAPVQQTPPPTSSAVSPPKWVKVQKPSPWDVNPQEGKAQPLYATLQSPIKAAEVKQPRQDERSMKENSARSEIESFLLEFGQSRVLKNSDNLKINNFKIFKADYEVAQKMADPTSASEWLNECKSFVVREITRTLGEGDPGKEGATLDERKLRNKRLKDRFEAIVQPDESGKSKKSLSELTFAYQQLLIEQQIQSKNREQKAPVQQTSPATPLAKKEQASASSGPPGGMPIESESESESSSTRPRRR